MRTMTQNEFKEKRLCINCRWCVKCVTQQRFANYKFKCANDISSFDPVTGETTFVDCAKINRNGDCTMYDERRRNIFERMFNLQSSVAYI